MTQPLFQPFQKFPSVIYAMSTISDGSIKNEDGYNHQSIDIFSKRNNIDSSQMVFMQQVHSGNVAVVADVSTSPVEQTDGLITSQKQLFLSILTADCLPLVFYDPEQQIIAAAHAGYKGLLNGIIRNTLRCMHKQFGSQTKDIHVGIGPGIGACCYTIDSARADMFRKLLPNTPEIVEKRNKDLFLDLVKGAEVLLASENVSPSHIYASKVCTKDASDRYFSYRRGDRNQRMVTIIGMI